MLAYAANRPVAGKRPSSPPVMLLIVSAHVALIALAMSAKMEFSRHRPVDGPTIYIPPSPPPPPPTDTSVKRTRVHALDPQMTKTPTETQLPPAGGQVLDGGTSNDSGPVALGGGGMTNFPPLPTPIRHNARLLTSPSDLKPPYPEMKILSGEEATLQLRLTISESGRVTAVEPVGPADRVFLEAARRYLIAHWRYAPATIDGRPTPSSITISLRFQLDG